ncbi:hypothetical protein JR316_0008129 [Psilocybe cubensis]|nr:hypothetical protein JR316_0008129 [Psilocybe cubensis]KAH9479535.1 hypothetical protein JR316_0008129 [Psilocybe cubensis]
MTFTATNPDGVRIVDIFSAIVVASAKKYDMLSLLSNGIMSQRLHSYQAPALFTKAEILGESKYFAGFSNITGSAGSASVVVETETSAASALALRKIDF